MGAGREKGARERQSSDEGQSRQVGDGSFEALLGEAAHVSVAELPACLVGRELAGRFEVRERIGAGGMGIVYRAHDLEHDRTVALKTLSHLDGAGIYRLKQEFRALAGVVHPNLVQLYDLFSDGQGRWFFTMQLVDGVPFIEHVRTDVTAGTDDTLVSGERERAAAPAATVPAAPSSLGALREPELRAALGQLVAGVRAIHAAGKLHRDLKPTNVLVSGSGQVTILDFGLARPALERDDGDRSRELSGAGTPAYMAPEQLRPEGACPASDWYAVGAMLYEALTGRLPFTGQLHEILGAKQAGQLPTAPGEVVQGVPADLSKLALALLSPLPEARPDEAAVIGVLGEVDVRLSAPRRAAGAPEAVFVGREAELEQLRRAYARASGGEPNVLHVEGLSGIGKSALVARFLGGISHEALVLNGRCYERENVPFKALDAVIDDLSRHLNSLPLVEAAKLMPRDVVELCRVFPVLARVRAFEADAERPLGERDLLDVQHRAFGGLKELFGHITRRRPLVLFIDDLQWGDSDSALLLAKLLEPPDAPAMLLLGAHRSDEAADSPLLTKLRELGGRAGLPVDTLKLGPLSEGLSRQLARSLLGDRDTTSDAAEAIAAEAEGSPFFITELTQRREQPTTRGQVSTVAALIQARIAQLSAGARALLELLSLAARPLPQHIALRAAGLEVGEEGPMAELRAECLTRKVGPEALALYHDRIRETVAATVTEERARTLHAALGAQLETLAEPPFDALAFHHHAAGNLEAARRHAERAGEQAHRSLAFDQAARFYAMALGLAAADGAADRERLGTRLGESLAHAGRGADAGHALLDAAAFAPPDRALSLRRRAAEHLLAVGHYAEGCGVMTEVLRAVGLELPVGQKRALQIALLRAQLWVRGQSFRAPPPERIPATGLLKVDVCSSAANGLVWIEGLRGAEFQLLYLKEALRLGEPARVARALSQVACQAALLPLYPTDEAWARRLLSRAAELAAEVDDPLTTATVRLVNGHVALWTGNWRAGLEHCEDAEAQLRRSCPGALWELNMAIFAACDCLVRLGGYRALAERVFAATDAARRRGNLLLGALLEPARTTARIAADDSALALEECAATQIVWAHESDVLTPHVLGAIAAFDAHLYRGEFETALAGLSQVEDALARVAVRSQWFRYLFDAASARVAVASALGAEPAERARHLRTAERRARRLARNRIIGSRPLAVTVRAAVAHQRGQDELAVERLRQAVAELDQADMAGYAAAARYQLGKLLGGDEGAALVAGAETFFRDQSVVRPDRFARMLVPGFRD